MAKDADIAAKGDHLKYYCVVFGILVVVIAVVAFQQKAKLSDYRAANAHAQRTLTGKGLPAETRQGRPNPLPQLAVEVQKLVQGFKTSVGRGRRHHGGHFTGPHEGGRVQGEHEADLRGTGAGRSQPGQAPPHALA